MNQGRFLIHVLMVAAILVAAGMIGFMTGSQLSEASDSFGGAQWPTLGYDQIEYHQVMGLNVGTIYSDETSESAYSIYSWEGSGVVNYEPTPGGGQIFVKDQNEGGGYVLARAYLYDHNMNLCGASPCNYLWSAIHLNTTYFPNLWYDERVSVIGHELGHTFGLADHTVCSFQGLMNNEIVVSGGPHPCQYYYYGIKYPTSQYEISGVFNVYWP